MNTEYETFIDEITCEEIFDERYIEWLEEFQQDFINFELQEISESEYSVEETV